MMETEQHTKAALEAWRNASASLCRREALLTDAMQRFYDGEGPLPLSVLEEIQGEREFCRYLFDRLRERRLVAR